VEVGTKPGVARGVGLGQVKEEGASGSLGEEAHQPVAVAIAEGGVVLFAAPRRAAAAALGVLKGRALLTPGISTRRNCLVYHLRRQVAGVAQVGRLGADGQGVIGRGATQSLVVLLVVGFVVIVCGGGE